MNIMNKDRNMLMGVSYECLTDLSDRKVVGYDVIGHMSDILGIKERQLKNYINTARLIPEFEELLHEGRITLREAVRFSALDSDSQTYLFEKYSDEGSVTNSDLAKAKELSRIKEAEKKLDDISESLEKKKKIYENEHEELCSLSEKTKNKEKIKRQGRKELKAKQRLLKEEKRYKDASDALSGIKRQVQDNIKEECYNADFVLSSIATCLEKIEKNPYLILSDKRFASSLINISDRFFQLVNNYRDT